MQEDALTERGSLIWPAPAERRLCPDRRRAPTSLRAVLSPSGRRRGFRRVREGRKAFVDRPAPRVVALVIWIVVGSALDALLTPLHVAEGFDEANPIMAWLLARDVQAFVVIKIAVTALGAWILAVHQQFPLAHAALHGAAVVYLGILALHSVPLWAGG